MSATPGSDPRLDQAAATDESLIAAHEKLLGKQPDDQAHYRLMPLNLLFIFSGLIFFAGTYLNLFSGHFDHRVYDETAPAGAAEAPAAKVDPMVAGKKVYDTICITCHQATGQGLAGVYPPLAGSEWVNGSEERVIRIVLYGLQGKVTVKGTAYNAAVMPAVGKVAGGGFNQGDDKIAAVLTYIRASFGNTSGPITAEQVGAIHTKEADHKAWTEDELLKIK